MKRRLMCLLLAFCVVGMLLPAAAVSSYAAEPGPVRAALYSGATDTAYCGEGQMIYYSYTPSSSGTYVFESTNRTGDPVGYLYSASGRQIASDDDSGQGANFRITCSLTGGTRYIFGVRWHSGASGSISIRLVRDSGSPVNPPPPSGFAPNAIVLSSGATNTSYCGPGQMIYYSYTPSSSGTYVFESTNSYGDPVGYLYSASGSQITSDDDSGSGGNFRIRYNLTGGTRYVFGARWHSGGSGSISVRLLRESGGGGGNPNPPSSSFPPANPIVLHSGTTNTSYCAAGQTIYYSYTPSESGIYVLESRNSSGDSVGYLYSASGRQLQTDDDSGMGGNFSITCTLTRGTRYVFAARWHGSASGSISVNLRRISNDRGDIADTVYVGAGEVIIYNFAPGRSGTYVFESVNSSGDPVGLLLSGSGTELASDDDSGSGLNFRIRYNLTEGVNYEFAIAWRSSTASGNISYRIYRVG